MPKFLTDENFDRRIVVALRTTFPDVDLLTANQAGLLHTPDEQVLTWAAAHERVVLTHDYDSMIGFAKARLAAGLPMPGLVMVPGTLSVGLAVRELTIIVGAARTEDLESQVRFVTG